jgi:acetyl-CoA synthetase
MAGYRIGPFEVESAMATHPAVAESAVIAVPDEVRGEVIEAYVVLRDGYDASPEMAREIQQWVKTRFAAHAYPRAVHFADILPKTPSGKIQRFVLKQRRREELATAGTPA